MGLIKRARQEYIPRDKPYIETKTEFRSTTANRQQIYLTGAINGSGVGINYIVPENKTLFVCAVSVSANIPSATGGGMEYGVTGEGFFFYKVDFDVVSNLIDSTSFNPPLRVEQGKTILHMQVGNALNYTYCSFYGYLEDAHSI
jgi:hypothetical protein